MKKLIICTFLILVIGGAKAQHGGWTKSKGESYLKLSEWWQVADEHFVANGKKDPNGTRGTYVTNLYAERGLTDRLTVIAYIPLLTRTFQNDQVNVLGQVIPGQEGDANNGFGDVNLAVKYGIGKRDAKYIKSVLLLVGLPTGESSGGRDGSYQTGDGEFNQMIEFGVSRSLSIGKARAFATLYSGFNNRTNGFSDEFRYGGEFGIATSDGRLWMFNKLDGQESFKNGTDSAFGTGSIFANNTEYLSYTVEVAKYFGKNWGASASYSMALTGEIIFSTPAYSVGVFLDLK